MKNIRFCPQCSSEDVIDEDGIFVCSECNYSSPVFPEHSVEESDEDEIEDIERVNKKKKVKIKKSAKRRKK